MNHPEKKTPSCHHFITALLLVCTAALAVLFALLPAEQPKERSGGRLNLADEYHTGMADRLALIQLSDTVEAAPEKASTEPAPQAPSEEPASAPSEPKEQALPTTEPAEPSTPEPEETVIPTTQPAETEPEETEPTQPPKKRYRIPDTAVSAPLPDTNGYGVADTPADMAPILEQAADVLEGQKLLFTTEVEPYRDSKVYYYLDETIFSVVWKEKIDGSVFTFAEVKVMDPSQFRRYLSGGAFGSGKLNLTSEMCKSVNAVVGCSADFYAYRYEGVTVVDGIVEKVKPGVPDNCFVDYDGNLILEQNRAFSGKEEVQEYVDENNIQFSISFGPALVKDGEFCCTREYRLGQVYYNYPRAAICQMDKLHYLYVVSNAEDFAANMLPMMQFANRVAETGCLQAYAVDGGQTSTVVMNNEVRNHVNYGSERPISDIIYFATAKPAEEGNP